MAPSSSRLFLGIGVSDYTFGILPNALTHAEKVASAFERIGYANVHPAGCFSTESKQHMIDEVEKRVT